MKRSIIVISILMLMSNLTWAVEAGLTNASLEPENKDVLGAASLFIPAAESQKEVIRNPKDSRNWQIIDSLQVDSYIPAGGYFGVGVNGINHTMEIVSSLGNLIPEAEAAIFKAPRWLKAELENVFSQLSENNQLIWANLINETHHPYIDEVAFSIAQSSVQYLASEFSSPELFLHNAWLIYDHDSDLDYVEVVDYGNPASDADYFSTTRYWKMDSAGNTYQVEVPRDIYYMYLVHPKNTDEIPAYIDPEVVESNANHQNNIVSASQGVFWREYLYDYNDPGYPKLKYYLQECNIVWNGQSSAAGTVLGALNSWINESMTFTSDAERPHQPVRIYKKHIGRCGEHADLRSAAARAALIPCTSILTISTDHTWNEFWDEGWIHWDGSINNPLLYENGWGKHHGSVFEIRSNGVITSVSDKYSDGHATLNVYVLDQNNAPVDGARILLGMHNGSNIVADMVGFTGNDGKYTFVVGEDVTYYAQVTSYIGDIPGYMLLVDMAEDGMEYDLALYPGGTMPQTPISEIPVPEDDFPDYKLVVDCSISQQVPHGRIVFDDIDDTYFYDYGEQGSINFFMADLMEFFMYADDQPFQAFDPFYDVVSVTTEFALPVPTMGYWYAFFDNKYRVGIPQHLKGSISLYAYDNAGGTGTISGVISDEFTGEVLSDVQVTAGVYSTVTDDSGYYLLEVFPAFYEITCIAEEYFPRRITDIEVTFEDEAQVDIELTEFPQTPGNVTAETTAEGFAHISWEERAFLEIMNYSAELRELESYNVYVGENGTELAWDDWTLCGEGITENEFTDASWAYLPAGEYRYAVKAVYSGGNLSPAIFSNVIYNQMLFDVEIEVSSNSNDPVEGASVNLSNQESTNSIFSYTATLDVTGSVSFSAVMTGSYILSVQLENFDSYNAEIDIEEDTFLVVELIESLSAIFDLSVIDFLMSWEPVPASREFLNYNIYLDNMLDPVATTGAAEFTFEGVDNGYHIAAVTADYTTGESAFKEIAFEAGSSLNSNLIAYYPFNGDANDESGNNNHGTVFGELNYPAGDLSGAAAEFTGMNDYIAVSSIFTEAPEAFSLIWWLNPASCSNWNQQIRSAAGWNSFNFHTTAEGYFYTGINTGTRFTPDQLDYRTIFLNEWQQFCFKYDNGYGAFYINGEKIAAKTAMTAPLAWNGLWIGSNDSNTIDGLIDEVMLWDRAVGTAEIQYLYLETVPCWGIMEGHVFSLEGSEPVPGAVIKAGIFETTTDDSGYYILDLAATTYIVSCQLEEYDPVTAEIVIIPDSTVVLDFSYPFTGSEETELISADIKLWRNYPNPFNPATTIIFSLTAEAVRNANLGIYNLKGQKIKTIDCRSNSVLDMEGYNKYSVVWNGKDDAGADVSSGVYFIRLESGNFSASRKILLLK